METFTSRLKNIEFFDRNILDDSLMGKVVQYSEMSKTERYFLNGMIRHIKPKKILEVGVSAGGSSAIILNAIKDMPESILYSVDYSKHWYRNKNKNTGFIINECFPELADKWHLLAGNDVSFVIEDIGADIDFVLLDTVHIHPWETLNFVCVLPFLKVGTWVVLHDIALHLFNHQFLACRYLFDYVDSDNKIVSSPHNVFAVDDFINELCFSSNIGAFEITENTHSNIKKIFLSLTLPWGIEINQRDIHKITNIINKYYGSELISIFEDVLKLQKYSNNSTEGVRVCFKKLLKALQLAAIKRL